MAVISKGTTFATGDQVTALKLNNLADDATFASGAVDNVSTQLSSGAIIVKDGGVSTAKIANNAVTVNEIADDAVTINKIADAAIVTESEGIGSNDNDTTIPTSAAVKDYVDSAGGSSNLIEATRSSLAQSSTFNVTGYTITGSNVTEGSNGLLTITGSGIWAVSVNASVNTTSNGADWYASLYVNGVERILGSTVDTANSDQALSGLTFVNSSGSFTVQVRMNERVNGGTGYINDLRVEAIKLS